jgi:hypothetical protein
MNVAAVPETSVNKNGQTFPPKDKVWLSRYCLVTSSAFDTVGSKDKNHTQLGGFVAFRPHCGHYA